MHSEISQLLKQVLARSVLFRRNEELEDRYGGGAEEEVQIWLSSLAANKDSSDADVIVAFMDDCAQRCMRTPERYLDALDDVREGSLSNESVQLPSPLLMTLLEQLEYRIHAVSTEEQQHSLDSTSSPSFHSLQALLIFLRGLFVRLAAFCEPRALPVLWSLARKITTGKSFGGAQEDSQTMKLVQVEARRLQRMLNFTHSSPEDSAMDSTNEHEEGMEDFEVLYVEYSTITRLETPAWRSVLVKKVFAGYEDVDVLSRNVLRAVRLISHSLSAVTRSSTIDQLDANQSVISSLLLLLAELMVKLSENSPLISKTLKEYLFGGNEALRGFWIGVEGPRVWEGAGFLGGGISP